MKKFSFFLLRKKMQHLALRLKQWIKSYYFKYPAYSVHSWFFVFCFIILLFLKILIVSCCWYFLIFQLCKEYKVGKTCCQFECLDPPTDKPPTLKELQRMMRPNNHGHPLKSSSISNLATACLLTHYLGTVSSSFSLSLDVLCQILIPWKFIHLSFTGLAKRDFIFIATFLLGPL